MGPAFSIGNVLATSFRVWVRNLAPFLLLFAIIELPYLAWTLHTSAAQGELLVRIAEAGQHHRPGGVLASTLDALAGLAIAILLERALGIFASAAVTYGVVMDLGGRRAGLVDCVLTGLRRMLPALAVGALTFACFLGGFVLLIIPGYIALCALWVAVQASVIERPGILGALRRSAALTRGHRLEIFALLMITGMMAAAAGKVVTMILVPGDVAEQAAHYDKVVFVQWVMTVVFGSLGAVLASVSYHLLRVDKEGTPATELARAFDPAR